MSSQSKTAQPFLVVVMGVSGCGKSTLAAALAEHTGAQYLDADDFHSDEAKALMRAGTPLTDAMREPWVDRIRAYLDTEFRAGRACVLAFSGLRRAHRARLREILFTPQFLFLDTDEAAISARHAARANHFMNPALIKSQFDALERPDDARFPEADVVRLDANQSFADVLSAALAAVTAKD